MADIAKKIYTAIELAGDYYKSATILYSEYQLRDSISLLPSSIEQYTYAYAVALVGKEIQSFSLASFLKSTKKNDELADKIKAAREKMDALVAVLSIENTNKKDAGQQEKQLEQLLNNLEQIEWKLQRFVRKQYPKEMPKWLKFILMPVMPIARWCNKQIEALIVKLVAFYKVNFPKERLNKIKVVALVIASFFVLWWIGSQAYAWYYSEYRGPSKPGLYGVYYKSAEFKTKPYAYLIDDYFDFGQWTKHVLVSKHKKETGIIWNGILSVPQDGTYNFFINVDNIVHVYVDDINVINVDSWNNLGDENADKWPVFLKKGKHNLKIVYGDWGGGRSLCIKIQEPNSEKRKVLDGHYLSTK